MCTIVSFVKGTCKSNGKIIFERRVAQKKIDIHLITATEMHQTQPLDRHLIITDGSVCPFEKLIYYPFFSPLNTDTD